MEQAAKTEADKLLELLQANTNLTQQDKELTEQIASPGKSTRTSRGSTRTEPTTSGWLEMLAETVATGGRRIHGGFTEAAEGSRPLDGRG